MPETNWETTIREARQAIQARAARTEGTAYVRVSCPPFYDEPVPEDFDELVEIVNPHDLFTLREPASNRLGHRTLDIMDVLPKQWFKVEGDDTEYCAWGPPNWSHGRWNLRVYGREPVQFPEGQRTCRVIPIERGESDDGPAEETC